MVKLVIEVAAFWAADTIDEKNPPPALTFLNVGVPTEPVGVLVSSIVGVNGATIDVDSLVFWWSMPGPDLVRR